MSENKREKINCHVRVSLLNEEETPYVTPMVEEAIIERDANSNEVVGVECPRRIYVPERSIYYCRVDEEEKNELKSKNIELAPCIYQHRNL